MLVLLGMLFGAYLAPALTRTELHASKVDVLVRPITLDPLGVTRADQLISLDTEAVVVRSDSVLSAVKVILDNAVSVKDLRNKIAVSAVPGSQVLSVSFTGSSDNAERGAAAVAEAYLTQRAVEAGQVIEAERSQLEGQIGRTQDRFSELAGRIGELSRNDPQRVAVEAELNSAVNEGAALQLRLNALERVQIDPGKAVSRPTEPESTGLPRDAMALGGALTGMVLALGLTLVLDRVTPQLHRVRRPRAERLMDVVPAIEGEVS